MHIAGIKKSTLLDYPGRVAATVFTAGCDLACPFCHNSSLVEGPFPRMEERDVLDFLKKRSNKLSGVCITGGEPTLQKDILDFIKKIKDMGFLLKLDTNGTRPEVLRELISEGLLDHAAMDVKTSRARYAEACGISPDMDTVCESVRLIMESGLPEYEFRTTVVAEYYDGAAAEDISQWLRGAERYVLQGFADSEDVIVGAGKLHGRSREEIEAYAGILRGTIKEVSLRGID